jgi:predicted deacylase
VQPATLRAHQFAGLQAGSRLIVLGAVHGNEVCGTRAIERVLHELDSGALRIERGQLTLLPVTNPLAYRLGQRQGDRNLNRNLRPVAVPQDFEDRIANVLCPWLDSHDVLLDLHSFHTDGQPFVMLGPPDNAGTLEPFAHALEEERLVAHLGPRRVVEGWLDTYARGVQRRRERAAHGVHAGTLDTAYGVGTTEYMRARGGYGVTLECGQHDDPAAPDVGYRAIRQTLALLGLAPIALQEPGANFQVLRLVDVVDRDHQADQFVGPWKSFDPVSAGQAIGRRHDGAIVRAPADGLVVFPNPNALVGNEWFYFAQPSPRTLSTAPRRHPAA